MLYASNESRFSEWEEFRFLILLIPVFAVSYVASAQSAVTWEGTTDQGQSINFLVDGSSIKDLEVPVFTSSCGRVTSTVFHIPITGNSFSYQHSGPCPGTTISGRFLSETSATGSVQLDWGYSPFACPCYGTDTVTWNAQSTAPPTSYLLTVDIQGSGSGTVTSNLIGINCGTDCNESYSLGTRVTLTAMPDGDSTFSGWSGVCSGTGECSITMNAAQSVIATFNSENPINDLVYHYYQAILGRDPDTSGLSFWDDEIIRLRALGINVQEAFRILAGQFFTSPEYYKRNRNDSQFVTDLYQTFFLREPDGSGLSFWVGQMAASLPHDIVRLEFLFSPEFAAFMERQFGLTVSRGEVDVIVDFYRGLLGRLPDDDGFNYWLKRFRTAQCQGAAAVTAEVEAISALFANSNEYRNRARNNGEYVTDLYDAFLRRGGDLGGYRYWVDLLENGTLNREGLRKTFLQTPEFQNRVQRVIFEGCFW